MTVGNDAADGQNGAPGHRRRQDLGCLFERFASLTGIRVRATNVEGLPRTFLSRPMPAPDLLVREYGDELKPRTSNALCRFEPGTEHEPWTIRRLLELPGFGLFSLLDLFEVLARHGVPMSPPQAPTVPASSSLPVASGLGRREPV